MTTIPNRPMRKTLQIAGPVGPLEAIMEYHEDQPPRFIAVCCHPHPQFQGTMLNKVVHTLARACLDQRGVALRFNYRGVGKSAGEYDDGVGETADAAAALRELRNQFGELPIILCGFSFGAGVVLRLALEESPDALVTVAPPVGRLGVPDQVELAQPWLLVQGLADDVVDSAAVLDWAQLQPVSPEIHTLDDVGHFFHGSLNVLRERVGTFIERAL